MILLLFSHLRWTGQLGSDLFVFVCTNPVVEMEPEIFVQ